MNKLKIKIDKEIELPDEITIEELNQLSEYVKGREEELFTSNKNIDKNRINNLSIYLEKDNGETFKLPDNDLPKYILEKQQESKIIQFPSPIKQ